MLPFDFAEQQGRIQDLKNEATQVARGQVFGHIWANLEYFLKNLAQKRVSVHPLRPAPLCTGA